VGRVGRRRLLDAGPGGAFPHRVGYAGLQPERLQVCEHGRLGERVVPAAHDPDDHVPVRVAPVVAFQGRPPEDDPRAEARLSGLGDPGAE
jgi:hypothetical protein